MARAFFGALRSNGQRISANERPRVAHRSHPHIFRREVILGPVWRMSQTTQLFSKPARLRFVCICEHGSKNAAHAARRIIGAFREALKRLARAGGAIRMP